MRILVNYDKAEINFLPVLQFFIKKMGYEAIATNQTLGIGDLIAKAQAAHCQGIFLVNPHTLANCVSGESPTLDDWRGSKLSFSVPTIVGNSLAHTQTVAHGAWLLEKDLDKFKHLSPIPKKQEFSFKVLETVDLFEDAYSILSKAEFIAYDIETKTINEEPADSNGIGKAGDTIITCCSWTAVLADRTLITFVLPLVSFLEEHWKNDVQYGQAIGFLRAVNKLPQAKAMHNGMYDCTHSIVYHAEPHNWVLDTMAMMHSEFSELPKSLDFVASVTLPDYCQWKSEANEASKSKDIQRYWAYNARDTWTTARIALYYLDKLPAYARVNYREQFRLVYPSIYCNFEGFKIDQGARATLRAKEVSRIEGNLVKLQTMLADPKFNPSSPKQVATYIYDVMGASDPKIGTKKDTSGRKVRITRGTNEKNLSAVGTQHPFLMRLTNAIIDYREARKAVSTYMDFLQKNGRMLYALDPFGTESGRMACRSSSFWCGTQVQNIPSYAKGMLLADEGFEFCEPDFSQAEARCTAYLSQDLKLIAALESKTRDFYTTLGTLFFSIPYEKVTKEFRNKILKKIVHGTNYMMGAQTFVENAGAQNLIDSTVHLGIQISLLPVPPAGTLSLKQYAQKLLDSYHIPFFRVKLWYQEIKNEILTTHKLTSPLGHTRYFFGDVVKSHQAFNSAVAHAPQNLSVSLLNKGFWKVWQLVKKHEGNLRLKAQVHDSMPFQYRSGRTDIRDEVLQAIDNPATIHGRSMRIPVEYKEGKSWGEAK